MRGSSELVNHAVGLVDSLLELLELGSQLLVDRVEDLLLGAVPHDDLLGELIDVDAIKSLDEGVVSGGDELVEHLVNDARNVADLGDILLVIAYELVKSWDCGELVKVGVSLVEPIEPRGVLLELAPGLFIHSLVGLERLSQLFKLGNISYA